MSKLAKKPLIIPKGVEIKLNENKIIAIGPKGTLELNVKNGIMLEIKDEKCFVKRDEKISNAFYGLFWALIKNVLEGVSKGFEKRLVLIGVGYRAFVKGDSLDVQVGYSHPTFLNIPSDLQVKVEKSTEIIISGMDKQKIGQFAAKIRSIRPPEPYKGKGIRYKDEYVRKKAGKAKTKGAT